MPRLTFRMAPGGPPFVDVTLEPSGGLRQWLAKNGRAPAIPVNVSMLVDTGADVTLVTGQRINVWGVPTNSGHKLRTVAGDVKVPAFELDIVFFHPQGGQLATAIDRVLVGAIAGRPWAGRPFQGVIGRDVLDRLQLFTYGGSPRECAVEY